jgi:uncharacterized protein with PQ loop repeat
MLRKLFSLDSRVWSASFLNVVAMGSQLHALWITRNADSMSLVMLVIFMYVQVTFTQLGYRNKSWGLFWGMLICLVITILITILTLHLKYAR